MASAPRPENELRNFQTHIGDSLERTTSLNLEEEISLLPSKFMDLSSYFCAQINVKLKSKKQTSINFFEVINTCNTYS